MESALRFIEVSKPVGGVAPTAHVAAVHVRRIGQRFAGRGAKPFKRHKKAVHHPNIRHIEAHRSLRLRPETRFKIGVDLHFALPIGSNLVALLSAVPLSWIIQSQASKSAPRLSTC